MDCIDDFFMSVYLVECVLKIYVMRKEVNQSKIRDPRTARAKTTYLGESP